jgi:hypothetical protein
MDIDAPTYSDWFSPRHLPAEIPLPERTLMALANKPVKLADPVQPKCLETDELVDVEPNYDADETPETEASK